MTILTLFTIDNQYLKHTSALHEFFCVRRTVTLYSYYFLYPPFYYLFFECNTMPPEKHIQ